MDDLYPNAGDSYQDSSYYPEPALTTEQKEAEANKAGVLSTSYPVLEKVADWFNEQVEACDSRRTITLYAKAHGLDKQLAGEAFDILRELLEAKAHEFDQFRSSV